MKIWSIIKQAFPFVLGLLVGAGFTKNKNVVGILIGYLVFMILFRLLKSKIMKSKETSIKQEAMEAVKDVGEITLKGNERGANLFDKYYGEYIFYVNVILFISCVLLLAFKLWLWALVCFLGMQFHMVLNQSVRMMREIKEDLKNGKKE